MVDVPPQPDSAEDSSRNSSIIETCIEPLPELHTFEEVNEESLSPSRQQIKSEELFPPSNTVPLEQQQSEYYTRVEASSNEFNLTNPYSDLNMRAVEPDYNNHDSNFNNKKLGKKNQNWKSEHSSQQQVAAYSKSGQDGMPGVAKTQGITGKRGQQKSLQFQRLQRRTEVSKATMEQMMETEPADNLPQLTEESKQTFIVHADSNQDQDSNRYGGFDSNVMYLQLPKGRGGSNGQSNLSISSIQSIENSMAQKPNMELLKQIDNRCSIEYDENEFLFSTQEGQLKAFHQAAGQPDNETPRINQIRGLTPQKRLMSSQRMDNSVNDGSGPLSSKIIAQTVGDKEQFQSEIAFQKVEQKRSSSVSAKKSAAELQQPYNRRAQLMRERKDQMKLKAREESFQKSQKKTDSINRLYSRAAQGTKGIFQPGYSMTESQKMFNSSLSVSQQQTAQMQTQMMSGGRSTNQTGSMFMQEAFNQSSFDLNEQLMVRSNNDPEITIRATNRIQPGNQQFMSQSMLSSGKPVQTDESNTSGIERAKQMFNDKLSKMVSWGNFTSSMTRQKDSNQRTEIQIGERNQQEFTDKPPTFGVDNYNFGVFTPPAMKNFKLTVTNNGRIVPYTEREAEGSVPNPNRGGNRPQPQYPRQEMQKSGVKSMHAADHSVRGEVTINPNGKHGVALSMHQQIFAGKNDDKSTRRMPLGTPARSTKSLRDLLSGARRQHHQSNIVSSTREQLESGGDHTSVTRAEDLSHLVYSSVNSPSTKAMKQGQKNQSYQAPQNQSIVVSEHTRRTEHAKYPCSAFFQNESNFEKAQLTGGSSFYGQQFSPVHHQQQDSSKHQQSETVELQSVDTYSKANATDEKDKKFITSFHPSANPPANIQGEEDLVASIASLAKQCQSPIANRNHRQMHQSSSSKNIVFGRQSLTARKNMTHQKNSPVAIKQAVITRYQIEAARKKKQQTHQSETSPRFKVIDQQREISMGRFSIRSIGQYAVDLEDDLPPDPLLQTLDTPRQTPRPSKGAAEEEEKKEALKQQTRKTLQGKTTRKDLKSITTRNEIIAVAPKSSILGLGLAMQTSETTQMSVPDSAATFQVDMKGQVAQSRNGGQGYVGRLATQPDQRGNRKDEIIKVEEEDKEDQGKTESEKKQRKRENSFIRDGYEIYVEGTYIVNGRKKKKVKKRKLSKQVIDKHSRAIEEKVRRGKEAGSDTQRLERELEAITKIGQQTLQMAAKQKIVQLKPNQIKMQAAPPESLTGIQLSKHIIGGQMDQAGQNSPRISCKTSKKRVTKYEQPVSLTSSTSNLAQQKPIISTKNITRIKLQPGAKNQAQVQIPRKLFIKNKSPEGSSIDLEETKGGENSIPLISGIQSPYLEQQTDGKGGSNSERNGTLLASASLQSLNFRDPDLQLVTSARVITLRDVAASLFDGNQKFILQRMIFQRKFPELLKVFRSGFLNDDFLNKKDHRGNTPLLLAAKLSSNEEEFLKCINFLFKQGCDGKIRDASGWSIIDEAIMQSNSRLLAIAFSWLNIRKKEKIQRNKERVIDRLKKIPDFYVELHWECQSSWIPFLSRMAPSDDFQIWKVGSNIRLDFSLVGFKNLQNKRRRMTILFRDAGVDETDERYKDMDILMVNRDRKIISNPLEDLDDEEKLAVLTDIMNADPVQNELNITRQEWSQVSNFFGGANTRESINGFSCSRYKLAIEAQVRSKKKISQVFDHTYEGYFEGAEEFQEGQQREQDPLSFKMAKDVSKTVESQLWLSQDYPLQFGQFMEVLDTLAISGQASMQKIHEFLQNDCLQDVVNQNGFPVKIQVPIGVIVKAMVTFGNFEFLTPPNKEEFVKETFQVPDYCNLVSRKEGMKTMQSKKKRLAVANVVI